MDVGRIKDSTPNKDELDSVNLSYQTRKSHIELGESVPKKNIQGGELGL